MELCIIDRKTCRPNMCTILCVDSNPSLWIFLKVTTVLFQVCSIRVRVTSLIIHACLPNPYKYKINVLYTSDPLSLQLIFVVNCCIPAYTFLVFSEMKCVNQFTFKPVNVTNSMYLPIGSILYTKSPIRLVNPTCLKFGQVCP